MATMDVRALETFVAVIRSGSFTRAAAQLGTHKAHASRVVSRLEAQLGAVLLQRSTRSLALTEVGREVYERALGILGAVDETVRAVQETQAAPRGLLRITCGTEFGILAVNDWIGTYLGRFPEVRIEADFTNRIVDLIHEGFDVAIRVGALDDSGLAARKLGEVTYGLYAAPEYLARRAAPKRVDDLARHELVLSRQTGRQGSWTLVGPARARRTLALSPRLLVNTHLAVSAAAAAGIGVALLPDFQAAPYERAGRLRRVLPAWSRDPVPVHAVYPSPRYLTPKVRAFVDCAREALSPPT